MRRSHTERKLGLAEINLTPMIDVVFILLIFFIVTASFNKESKIEVNRPNAASASAGEKTNLIVSLNRHGEIWLDNQQIDLRLLHSTIQRHRAQDPEADVLVLVDQETLTGRTVAVLDQIRLAGVRKVAVAAKKKPST